MKCGILYNGSKNMNGYNQIDNETKLYQEQTASIRFRQNLIHGIGAATVFGAATGMFGYLFNVATGGALKAGVTAGVTGATTAAAEFLGIGMAAWAGAGIALAVVIGFGCLYASSKLASQLVRIEQDHHASQIAKGINGRAPTIEVTTKPVSYPSQAQDKAPAIPAPVSVPAPLVNNIQLDEKVVPITALSNGKA